MATIKFYHDTRGVPDGKPAPIKLAITHKTKTAMVSLGVSVPRAQWDKQAQRIVGHPNKAFLNNYLANRRTAVGNALLQFAMDGALEGKTATEIKKMVLAHIAPEAEEKDERHLFIPYLEKFSRDKKKLTRATYEATRKKIERYLGAQAEDLQFEDMTKDWLERFFTWMAASSPSVNARNIHMRNIRAVFNDALDDEFISCYPFRRFKIRAVETVKRSLSVEQLRAFFACPVEDCVQKYQDMFKLIFFLIGINVVDLCQLREVVDGRIVYYRSKTGRLYNIKVEPEAMEIIDRYRGKEYLLNVLDAYEDYRNYNHRLNWNLQHIGEVTLGKRGKKTYTPMFPKISTYWARHSWATIAASLDIPKETIAAALGHGGNTVTDIYIDFDQRKVDEANRRVLDWVLYGKK